MRVCFQRILPLCVILAGCFASAPAFAQCANGYTNAIGDRICGTSGGGAPVSPGISGATRGPITANGGPVYEPARRPPQGETFDYTQEDIDARMDEIEGALQGLNGAERRNASNIMNEMMGVDPDLINDDGAYTGGSSSINSVMEFQGPVLEAQGVSFDGDVLNYDYNVNYFMGQAVTPWPSHHVSSVLTQSEVIMQQHFTPEEQAAANAILQAHQLDTIMDFGGLAVNNPLTYSLGQTSGGVPVNLEYDENIFMGNVVSNYTQAEVDAQMGEIEDVLGGYSDDEMNAASDILSGMTAAQVMDYAGPINSSTTTPHTLATTSGGTPITFDFVENTFMGQVVTQYTPAQVQTQMDDITAALVGFTDEELATVQTILNGMTLDEIMTYAGPLSATGATPYQVATDSLGNPVNFTFNANTFMGTPVTAHDPGDVQDAMDAMTEQLLGVSDADLATVQTQLAGMTIDDIMAHTGDFVTTTPGATYNVGATGISWDVPNAGTFMGTALSGGSLYSNFTPLQMQTRADDIAAAITGMGAQAGTANIQNVLDGMTPAAIMNYAPPFYTTQTLGVVPTQTLEVSFMGAVVHTEPI